MNIASCLTLSRVVFTPLLAFLIYNAITRESSAFYLFSSFILFLALEFTDMLDGMVARKRNEVTAFGKLLDPMADSLMHHTILAVLMISGILPIWLFLIFIYRDGFLSIIRLLNASMQKIQGARMSGKIKTVSLSVSVFLILSVNIVSKYRIDVIPDEIFGRHPGFFFLLISALLSVLSAVDYGIAEWSTLKTSFRK